MNNCQYTQTQILPRINKSFQEVGELSLEKPISEAIKCYVTLDSKLFEAYMEQKTEPIGKKHALKKYDQFTLNTSCFWGITGANITPVVQFHEIFVTIIHSVSSIRNA